MEKLKTLQVHKIGNEVFFTSNDEIKEGNWAVTDTGIATKVTFAKGASFKSVSKHCNRIEASTDPYLNLPLIPESFIQEFVKQNGDIKEVEVRTERNGVGEFETVKEFPNNKYYSQFINVIKTNPDNTVIWSLKQDNTFDNYKKLFDQSFAKVTPRQFIKEMEAIGYKFIDLKEDKMYSKKHILSTVEKYLNYLLDKNSDKSITGLQWFEEHL